MSEKQETSVEDQHPELLSDLVARPTTPAFYADNYTVIRTSILAGMGLEEFDNALADRMEAAIKQGILECWALFEPSDEVPKLAGSITFFIASDPLLGVKYLYIYSLHCSRNVALEAWRKPFMDIFAHAEKNECKFIWARTGIDHVVAIAKDNGFTVSAHLERTV